MNKSKDYFGIDISKATFDVYNDVTGHHQFKNDKAGFKVFAKLLGENAHCVMESTGYYHYSLACFLTEKAFDVTVENPLKIKRFIQMKLAKIKTDKADAKYIWEYSVANDPKIWKVPNMEAKQLLSLIDTYQRQSTQYKNKIKGENVMGTPSKLVIRSMKRSLKNIQKEIAKVEGALEPACRTGREMIKAENSDALARLQTIPGFGKKTAMMLLVVTDHFRDFESAAQLCSFAGLTPVIRTSGSSVRGRERISKMGHPKLRNLLFLCSFNASKYNKQCKDLYDRIVAKGKSKKLALIAVCNKLLKQAFGIMKSGLCYDENFKSVLARN
jgi:transposase